MLLELNTHESEWITSATGLISLIGAGGLAGVIGTFIGLKRKYQHNESISEKEREEVGLISRFKLIADEAQASNKLLSERLNSFEKVNAMLTAENEYLRKNEARLISDFDALRKQVARLSPEMNEYFGTDFSGLNPRL